MKTYSNYIFFILIWSCSAVIAQVQVETITDEIAASGGLTLGPDGKLYIANFGESLDNGRGTEVWQLDFSNTNSLTIFATGLLGASGNDFDSQGNLFQSNIAAGDVRKIDPNGRVTTFTGAGISCNVGVNIDADDNLYVCNCCGTFGNTIRKITPTGASTVFANGGLFACPNGITRDMDNNLYVSNFGNGNIVKITPTGQTSLLASTPGTPGIASASNGHITYSSLENVLYVASHGSHKIYKLTLDGQLTVLAGSGQRGNTDGVALQASFSRPNGLALSITEDTLFVNSSVPTTDSGGRPLNPSVIRMITGLRNPSSTTAPALPPVELSYSLVSNELIIRGTYTNEIELRLVSAAGQVFYVQNLSSGVVEEARLNIPIDMPSGIYWCQLSDQARSVVTSKIAVFH